MAWPLTTTCVELSKPNAAGLKYIAAASSKDAADPANEEPTPLADCSISEKPAAFATDERPRKTEDTVIKYPV